MGPCLGSFACYIHNLSSKRVLLMGILRDYHTPHSYQPRGEEGWGFWSSLLPVPIDPKEEKYGKLLFFERSPPRGGTLRDSGWESLAPAAGYIWGGTLRESGSSCRVYEGHLSFASVVLMCRLYLSRRGRRKERISL